MWLKQIKVFVLVALVALLVAQLLNKLQKSVSHNQNAKKTYQEKMSEFRNDPKRFRGIMKRGNRPRYNFIIPGMKHDKHQDERFQNQNQISIDKEARKVSRKFDSNKFWLDAAASRATGVALPEDIAAQLASPNPFADACAQDNLLCDEMLPDE